MVWFAASYGFAVAGFLLVSAAAGRWLGPDDFGLFAAALAATGLLGQAGLVGSHRSGLREVARLRQHPDEHEMGVLRNGVRAISLTTLPAAALLGGVGVWLLASQRSSGERIGLSLTLAVLVVLCGHQQLWANYARGLGHVRLASVFEGRSGGALVTMLQGLMVLVVWWAAPGWGLTGALLAVAAGYVVPVGVARHVVRRRWRGLQGPAPRLLRDLRHTLRRDWRFLSVQVATYLNISVEIWIAALLLSNVDTSMYSAGQRLAQLLVIPLTALQVVFAPVIARAAVGMADPVALQHLLRTGASLAAGLSLLLSLPMLVAPGLVLDVVYGPGFQAAVPVLLILAVGFFGNVATGAAGTALSMMGREGTAARVQWLGAVARVVIGVPAAVTAGLTGLTLSALSVSVLVFTLMWWRAHRELGVFTHATVKPDLPLLRRTAG